MEEPRGKSRNFLLGEGRVQTVVQKGLLNFFWGKLLLPHTPSTSRSCTLYFLDPLPPFRRWREKFCFASRGEQIIEKVPQNNYIVEYPWNLI